MASQIIESKPVSDPWLAQSGQPVAARVLAWEQRQADDLLADVFGYHAVQIGCAELQALRGNRMPHRWLAKAEYEWAEQARVSPSDATPAQTAHVELDSRAWPWQAESLDLVVLPHILERSGDPHACLRELERVLIPEGQVLITGFNPWSWWGLNAKHLAGAGPDAQPVQATLVAYRRLRDWLRLLGFEVQVSRFGGWTPALQTEALMRRMDWIDGVGERWWPALGGVYLILATKRVPGGRLLASRPWRNVRSSPSVAAVPVARSDTPSGPQSALKENR
jgi:SAM-dependent methyltransferase